MPQEPKTNGEKQDKEQDRTDNWAEDQKNREYYYDDAHGYEEYDAEADVDGDQEPQADDKE